MQEKEIEFAVSGSFEQLSEFKEKAEEFGWNYVNFTEFSKKEYARHIKPRILYFCDEAVWSCNDYASVTNGFSLTDVATGVILFDLDVSYEDALLAVKHGMKSMKKTEMNEFLDFIVDNYTIEDGDMINKENRYEDKEEVISIFKTMYGQTKV